ncbi:hypothetical protein LCGC14_1195760 [marine sediment metagenome]|uniref:CAAX prenyl protease 2/Lysostaphin resistance protein A-like domain-containing protein n=1 Tax=marine sediment metagenome TaxID=412755 RepID=A0A0F9LMW4_9ZZZZ
MKINIEEEKQKKNYFYKLSRFPAYEIMLEGLLASAGAHQSRFIEKLKKNKKLISHQFRVLKVAFSVILLFLSSLPIISYLEIAERLNQGTISLNTIFFISSFMLGIFFGMITLYMLLFGMPSTSSFMSGNAFKWLQTLPFSKKNLKKIGFMTLFRSFDIPLIILTAGFPIIMLIGTQDVLIFLISLLVSFINVVFSFSILVIIGEKLSYLFSESKGKSKKANIVRTITMLGYFIITFSMIFLIQWSFNVIDELFEIFATSEPSMTLNIILSLIPFLFAPAYLISLSSFPNQVPIGLLLSTLIGFTLFILLTLVLFKKAQGAVRSAISTEIKTEQIKIEKKDVQVDIKSVSPIKAYLRKDLVSTTRDITSFMYIFFPIFYPLILVLTLQGSIIGEVSSVEGILLLWSIILGVFLFIPIMLVTGFLNLEESGSSTVASLPVIPREQVKAKLILMLSIQGCSLILLSIVLTFLLNSFLVILLLIVALPIAWTFLLFVFEMKIVLFGKMKYKYIIEELNKEHKIAKWILMILSEAGLYFIILIAGVLLISVFGITIAMLLLLLLGVIGLSCLIYVFTKMFPKVEKMSEYETGGLLRNKPILGVVVLTFLYFIFGFLAALAESPLLFFNILTTNNYITLLFIDFFFQFGFLAILWLFVIPKGMKLPEMSDSFKDYSKKIHLSTIKPIGKNILLGVGSFTIFGIIVFFGAILLGNYVFDPSILFGNPNPSGAGLAGLGWFLFIIMLIPGIWEEIAFRGVAIPMLIKKYRVRTSLIISSVIFGFAHTFNIIAYILIGLDPLSILFYVGSQVIYATLLGFAFGYMYIKTKSLLPSIILHFLIDSVGQILLNTIIDDIFLEGIFLVFFLGLIPAMLIILMVKLVVKSDRNLNSLENF